MRAARYHRFGPPDVLRVEDVPDPEPGPGEVLVRVRAASVEGGEQSLRSGKLRLLARGPFPRGVGTGFSGHVAALGAGVRGRRVGDPVWGLVPHLTTGSAAELVVVPQDRIARAPGNLDLLAAAALPVSGTTAITALRHEARLVAGERLLVRGAAAESGALRPDVDTVFALADVADAHRALEAGGVRGKHLVEVQP